MCSAVFAGWLMFIVLVVELLVVMLVKRCSATR